MESVRKNLPVLSKPDRFVEVQLAATLMQFVDLNRKSVFLFGKRALEGQPELVESRFVVRGASGTS